MQLGTLKQVFQSYTRLFYISEKLGLENITHYPVLPEVWPFRVKNS